MAVVLDPAIKELIGIYIVITCKSTTQPYAGFLQWCTLLMKHVI